MKKAYTILLLILCFSSCNQARVETNLKKDHFFAARSEYEWPISILKLSCNDWDEEAGEMLRDTMICCGCANDLYEKMDLKVFSEDSVMNILFNHCMQNEPIPVSSDLYKVWMQNKVIEDDDLRSLYGDKGIDGILEILSSKEMFYWDRDDYERFKYIIYLCWDHDIFFTDYMSDEAPNEMWFISGNTGLIEKYYNEGNKEQWHYVLEK